MRAGPTVLWRWSLACTAVHHVHRHGRRLGVADVLGRGAFTFMSRLALMAWGSLERVSGCLGGVAGVRKHDCYDVVTGILHS